MEGNSRREKRREKNETGKVEMAVKVRASEWVTDVSSRASSQMRVFAKPPRPRQEQGSWRIFPWTPG